MATRLPAVEETILKRKKRIDAAQARQARANLRSKKPRHATPRLEFKRAEKFIKEFRLRQQDDIRLSRQARWQRKDVNTTSETESKSHLAFAVRIRKAVSLTPRTTRALKLLRLNRLYSGCFLKLNTTTLNLLRVAEPFITWGYPSLKNVRELLYKHGHGSVNGRRTPLTSNADIEKVLGNRRPGVALALRHGQSGLSTYGLKGLDREMSTPPMLHLEYGHLDVICLEDIVHEIVTLGPRFKEVNTFLLMFRLNPPAGGWKKRSRLFADGGECGPRGDDINSLLRRMI